MKNGITWNDTTGNGIEAYGGGIISHNGYYYWHGEDKSYVNGHGNQRFHGISCYRSKDMKNWEYRGNNLPAVSSDPDHPLHTSKICEIPKVIYNKKTNKFVMILRIVDRTYDFAKVGFAVSNNPDTEFTYLYSETPNGFKTSDLNVFIDPKDESAYLFCSNKENGCLRAVKLSDNYLTYTDDFILVYPFSGEQQSRKAPTVLERNGKYYCITLNSDDNQIAPEIAVSDSIFGRWKVLGNPCVGRGKSKMFNAKPIHILKFNDKYILMLERFNKSSLSSSGYVWLEVEFAEKENPIIKWSDEAVIKNYKEFISKKGIGYPIPFYYVLIY